VQAIHQGQRDFMNNPFGGALMAFLSGAPLGGTGAILGRVMSGLRTLSPYAVKGGQAAFSAARGYASSLTVANVGINFGLSITSQAIIKGIGNVDVADAILSGVGGQGIGQVVTGGLGAFVDLSWNSSLVFATDKTGFQFGADLGTGLGSGLIGLGVNSPCLNLTPAWQNAGGFLNNMFGDGLNTTLTSSKN